MQRYIFISLSFLFLLTFQVSFLHALPFPLDHIPLLLALTIFLYQCVHRTEVWWWGIGYGAFLDIFTLSYAPLETISYLFVTIIFLLLARHVFTNRSFYAVAAITVVCLFALTISQILMNLIMYLFTSATFHPEAIALSNLWTALFAILLFFFLIPFVKHIRTALQYILYRST